MWLLASLKLSEVRSLKMEEEMYRKNHYFECANERRERSFIITPFFYMKEMHWKNQV